MIVITIAYLVNKYLINVDVEEIGEFIGHIHGIWLPPDSPFMNLGLAHSMALAVSTILVVITIPCWQKQLGIQPSQSLEGPNVTVEIDLGEHSWDNKDFRNDENPKRLKSGHTYICGSVGCGKSSLLCSIFVVLLCALYSKVMKDGVIVQSGTHHDILADPASKFAR
ncbi:hypothetical protein Tco_1442914 [Tanacetum coccineum]